MTKNNLIQKILNYLNLKTKKQSKIPLTTRLGRPKQRWDYKSIRTTGELIKYLQKFPENTRISRKNCDGSYNHSTRFYYDNGKILFGFEGSQCCIKRGGNNYE